MGTAQETYDEMVREGLRPTLKAQGFKGSGSTFTWPSRSHFAQLGFQESQFSDRDALRFTVNVTIADRSSWAGCSSRGALPAGEACAEHLLRRLHLAAANWKADAERGGHVVDHLGGRQLASRREAVLAAVTTHALPELHNLDAP